MSKGQKNQRDFYLVNNKEYFGNDCEKCPKYIHGKCSKPIHCLGDALDKHMISIINRKSSGTETC